MIVKILKEKMNQEFATYLAGAFMGVGLVATLSFNTFTRNDFGESINRVLEERKYIEFDDKMEIGSWRYPLGTVGIDEGKDGSIDRVEFRHFGRIPAPIYFEFETGGREFESMQRLYGAHRNSSGNDVL